MKQENLRHAKKHWYKGSFRFREVNKVYYKGDKHFYEVILYISDRQVAFRIYNNELRNYIDKVNAQEKIKVWFSAESKQYNDKWYTNLILKHLECSRLQEIEKTKEDIKTNNGFQFGEHSDF